MDQCVPGEDGTEEAAVEVLRGERSVTLGRILEQRHRVDDSRVQGGRVEQRLERRTWRASRPDAVDLARNLDVEESGRSDQGQHFHAAVVDEHRGGVGDVVGAPQVQVVADASFHEPLRVEVQRRPDFRCVARRHVVADEVRGVGRQGGRRPEGGYEASPGDGLGIAVGSLRPSFEEPAARARDGGSTSKPDSLAV